MLVGHGSGLVVHLCSEASLRFDIFQTEVCLAPLDESLVVQAPNGAWLLTSVKDQAQEPSFSEGGSIFFRFPLRIRRRAAIADTATQAIKIGIKGSMPNPLPSMTNA